MRPRTLLVLLLVVVGLAAFIWFYERDLPSTEERRGLAKRLLRWEPEEVAAIVIETERGRARLERVAGAAAEGDETAAENGGGDSGEGSWRLTEPHAARADAAAVDRLLESLLELEKRRELEEVDRAAVGLEAPRATVQLAGTEGDRRLELGADIPASSDMVLALDDSVYAVPSAVWSQLDKEPGDWRDRDVVPFSRDRIERIEISATEAPPVILARRDDEFWLEAPLGDRADSDRVDELLGDLEALRVEEFVDQPPAAAELGLEPPRGRFDLAVSGRQEPFRLELGSDEDEGALYARAGDRVFVVGDELAAALERPAAEWRSAMWSTFEVYQTDALTVRDEAGELEIRRDGADWRRGEETIENGAVRDFVYALTSAAADGFGAADRASLGEPVLEIELTGGERSETLALFAEGADGVPATASGRDAVLLLPAATAEEVRLKLQEVRDAEPLPAEDSPLGEGGGA